jgi:transposase
MSKAIKKASPNRVKRESKRRKAEAKIALLESIIADVRAKYNNTEIPRNSEDSHAIAKARGEIDRLIDWRNYGSKEYEGAQQKKEEPRKTRKIMFSPEDTEKIIQMRAEKFGYESIGKELGCSKNVIANFCKERGINGQPRKRKVNRDEAARLHNNGWSYSKIAKLYGVTNDAIAKTVKAWREEREDEA